MAKIDHGQPAAPRPRLTRDAERTRAALLKAGLKEFAHNGLAGGRLDRIVTAAGCNIRMVYHYYGGKAGLYAAVLDAAAEQMRQAETGLDIDLDRPLAGMLELMRFSYEFFERHPLLEALFRLDDLAPVKRGAAASPLAKGRQSRLTLIERLVASGQAKGLFRHDLDPLQVDLTISALGHFHPGPAQVAAFAAAPAGRNWRAQRLPHCLAFLEAALLDSGVKKRLVRAPLPVHVPTAIPRRRPGAGPAAAQG